MTDFNPRPRHFGPLDHLPPRPDTPEVSVGEARLMFISAIDRARQTLRMVRLRNTTIPEAEEMTANLAKEASDMSTEAWWYGNRSDADLHTPVAEWSKSKGGKAE